MRLPSVLGVLAAIALPAAAAEIPRIAEIPVAIEHFHPDLVKRRAELARERTELFAQGAKHDNKCRAVKEGSTLEAECRQSLLMLGSAMGHHTTQTNWFNDAVRAAARIDALDPDTVRIINSMNALAARLGWSAEERARLDRALNDLGFLRLLDQGQANAAWRDIAARGGSDWAQLAARGDGPGFAGPSAGEQGSFQDCAVFALANAANLPYGVVAARAARLIGEGDWRPADQRANPQRTIESIGLMGGEVVMLAEGFGRAQVVRDSDFARTLAEGRHVIVSVVPSGGNVAGIGHAVVLSKTFRHDGQTWFEMIDSHRGPLQRRYVTATELNLIVKENGATFRPDPGRTPQLLR